MWLYNLCRTFMLDQSLKFTKTALTTQTICGESTTNGARKTEYWSIGELWKNKPLFSLKSIMSTLRGKKFSRTESACMRLLEEQCGPKMAWNTETKGLKRSNKVLRVRKIQTIIVIMRSNTIFTLITNLTNMTSTSLVLMLFCINMTYIRMWINIPRSTNILRRTWNLLWWISSWCLPELEREHKLQKLLVLLIDEMRKRLWQGVFISLMSILIHWAKLSI